MRACDVVGALGRTLVLVPHPDDETIGCGGLLALLARAGSAVHIVLVSDGAASHPHSQTHGRKPLAALRLQEMRAALRELQCSAYPLTPLALPDGAVPMPGQVDSVDAVNRLAQVVQAFRPDSVVLPWRCDAHADHRASYALGMAVCQDFAACARTLEYAVWPPAEQGAGPLNQPTATAWQIDVTSVVQHKRRALAQHASQLGRVVLDDPSGFTLPASLIDACALPFETYYCTTHGTTQRTTHGTTQRTTYRATHGERHAHHAPTFDTGTGLL